MLRRWKEEGAVSPVIGTVILVAIAVVAAGVVYAIYGSAGSRDLPAALALTTGTSGDEERTFNVATATPGIPYSRVSLLLDEGRLAYDGTLSAFGTWCQETPFGTCVPTADFDETSSVAAGDRLRVRADGFAGKTLHLRDDAANTLLATIALH